MWDFTNHAEKAYFFPIKERINSRQKRKLSLVWKSEDNEDSLLINNDNNADNADVDTTGDGP